jgi:hypothetical protein
MDNAKQWTNQDIKNALANTLSPKQQNHINKNKKWLTKNQTEVTAKADEK